MIFTIAWKNIWRNKVRSSVVIIAIIIGLFGGTFSVALMNGMIQRRIKSVIKQETAHIQLHHPDFLANNDPEFLINDFEKVSSSLKKLAEVKAISSRYIVQGTASTARKTRGVKVISIDPEKEKEVSELNELLIDSVSSFFEKRTRYPVLIGKQLADKLNIRVGKKLMLTFQGADGYQTAGSFRVVGIYKTDNSGFNEVNVFVRHKELIKLGAIAPDAKHEIAVLLNTTEHTKNVSQKLKETFPELKVDTYLTLTPDIAMMMEYMDFFMLFFVAIILMALGFGIVNTMLMVVLERVKEFGMLMAIGMTKARVFSMILLETVYLLLFGGGIGMAISHFLTLYFGEVGIDISMYAEGFEALGYAPILKPEIGFSNYLSISFLIILTGIIASVYPAVKAIKLKPAEAIRTI